MGLVSCNQIHIPNTSSLAKPHSIVLVLQILKLSNDVDIDALKTVRDLYP